MKTKPTAPVGSAKWEEHPLEWLRDTGRVDLLMAALEVRKKRQWRRRLRVAGAAAVVVSLAGLWYSRAPHASEVHKPAETGSRSVVVAPERRTLPDGSVVELKPGAELNVNISSNGNDPREVSLTKGEALFQVARNLDRPFVVHVRDVRFRVVGTTFSIQVGGDSVEMLVTDGRVAVESRGHAESSPNEVALVEAGNHVVVETAATNRPEILAASETYTRERLAWRVPRLAFDETPLWEVVSLLNQHSSSRISLASPELGRVAISGMLRADNLEPLLRMLEANYPIEVARLSDGEIVLKSRR